jgi:hypothetical protein
MRGVVAPSFDGIIDPALQKSRFNTIANDPLSIQERARNGNTESNAALVPVRKVGRAPQGVLVAETAG